MKGRILGKVVGRTPVLGLVAALLAARQRLWDEDGAASWRQIVMRMFLS